MGETIKFSQEPELWDRSSRPYWGEPEPEWGSQPTITEAARSKPHGIQKNLRIMIMFGINWNIMAVNALEYLQDKNGSSHPTRSLWQLFTRDLLLCPPRQEIIDLGNSDFLLHILLCFPFVCCFVFILRFQISRTKVGDTCDPSLVIFHFLKLLSWISLFFFLNNSVLSFIMPL